MRQVPHLTALHDKAFIEHEHDEKKRFRPYCGGTL